MGKLRTRNLDMVSQILPQMQEYAMQYAKRTVKKKLTDTANHARKKLHHYVSDQVSELKRNLSGTKHKTEVKDYSQDMYAKLSSMAYEKDREKLRKDARKLGYDVDDELTTDNHKVFKHRQTGKAVIAYRGTDPSNRDDLWADADIMQGKRNHRRFNEALHVAKKAQGKYKDLEVTGHSLGGAQALHVYETLGVRTRVYNPGSTPKGQTLKIHANGVRPEIVRHEDDLVSLGYAQYATETYRHGENNPFDYPNLLKAHNIPGQ